MKAKVKYYLKDSSADWTVLYAAVHFMGRRYRIYTGEKILGQAWNQAGQRAKQLKAFEDADLLNDRLSTWSDIIERAFDKFSKQLYPPEPDEIKTEVNRLRLSGKEQADLFLPWVESFIPVSGRSALTRRRYNTSFGILKKFEAEKRTRIRYKDVDISLYRNLKTWMERAGYSLNTLGTVIKDIKVWMNESNDQVAHGVTTHRHLKFITPIETADTIYLSDAELLKIHQLNIDWELIMENFPKLTGPNITRRVESYRVIRDRFLIGCFTALRVSDFRRLNRVNVDDEFIRIRPEKGSEKNSDVVIPVHWIVREIIQRGFDWDRKVYDQKINKGIKEICRMAGIKDTMTISRTTGGAVTSETFEKWQLVTTHTARRSGATNMYKAGIPSLAIMKITGHKTERSFLKYIKISQEENAEMLRRHPYFRGGSV